MRWLLAGGLLGLIACGRVGFEAQTSGGSTADGGLDGTVDEASVRDASSDTNRRDTPMSTDGSAMGVFVRIPLPPGAAVEELRYSAGDPTRLYALASFRGVYHSGTVGADPSWEPCTRLPPGTLFLRGLSVAPETSATVFASMSETVFRSTDGCQTWTDQVDAPRFVLDLWARATADVFVGTTTGLYRWRPPADPVLVDVSSAVNNARVHQIVASADGQTVYVAAEGAGFARSTDGGGSWSPINTGVPTFPRFDDLRLLETNNSLISQNFEDLLVSTDGGDSWALAHGSGGYAAAADPQDPNFVVAQHWAMLRSGSMGATSLEDVDRRSPNMYSARARDFQFLSDGTLLAATSRGVFALASRTVAPDGTLPWTLASEGMDAWIAVDMALDPRQPDRIYLATEGGALVSEDEGRSGWVQGTGFRYSGVAHAIVSDPVVADRVWTTGTHIFRSDDAGRTFLPLYQASGADDNEIKSVAIDVDNPDTLLAGTGTRLLRFTDGGMVPTPLAVNAEVDHILQIGADDFLVGAFDGVHRIQGGGAAIAHVGANIAETNFIAESPGGGFYASSDCGLFFASAANGPWVRIPFFGNDTACQVVADVVPIEGSTVVAMSEAGVFISSDSGNAWTELVGLAYRRPSRGRYRASDRTLFVSTRGNGLFRTTL